MYDTKQKQTKQQQQSNFFSEGLYVLMQYLLDTAILTQPFTVIDRTHLFVTVNLSASCLLITTSTIIDCNLLG